MPDKSGQGQRFQDASCRMDDLHFPPLDHQGGHVCFLPSPHGRIPLRRQRRVRDADTELQDGLGFQRRVYIGFAVIGITWIAVLLSILLGCQPLHKNWQIYPDPGSTSPFS
jgi:hypothetical protein